MKDMQHQLVLARKVIMTSVDILHMNTGDGDLSYANNSLLQKTVIEKAAPVLKHTIKDMANQGAFFDHCFMIADLGCSSGMNTLLVAREIIDTVYEVCKQNNRKAPRFQVCLNDLFQNDFNCVFKLLPNFYKVLKKENGERFGPCFVSAVPGSFYGRLFPDESMHLVHSSYSIHWLSQVPKGLDENKTNIYMAKTSPRNVFQAYGEQFRNDFTKFLKSRREEIVHGGRMVLTLRSRSSLDPTLDDSSIYWELLTTSLLEMVEEGLVQESDIISFNLPFYFPYVDEVRSIIQAEASFYLDYMSIIDFTCDKDDTGHNAKLVRAITEPLFTHHFGESIIDVLFEKVGRKVTEHLATKKIRHVNVVVSLTKK